MCRWFDSAPGHQECSKQKRQPLPVGVFHFRDGKSCASSILDCCAQNNALLPPPNVAPAFQAKKTGASVTQITRTCLGGKHSSLAIKLRLRSTSASDAALSLLQYTACYCLPILLSYSYPSREAQTKFKLNKK